MQCCGIIITTLWHDNIIMQQQWTIHINIKIKDKGRSGGSTFRHHNSNWSQDKIDPMDLISINNSIDSARGKGIRSRSPSI
jgi:hypothetical protein